MLLIKLYVFFKKHPSSIKNNKDPKFFNEFLFEFIENMIQRGWLLQEEVRKREKMMI